MWSLGSHQGILPSPGEKLWAPWGWSIPENQTTNTAWAPSAWKKEMSVTDQSRSTVPGPFCCCWVPQSCLTLCDPMDWLCVTPFFSRQEYWSGLPYPPPGDFPNPGIEPESPALAGGFFTTNSPGKPLSVHRGHSINIHNYHPPEVAGLQWKEGNAPWVCTCSVWLPGLLGVRWNYAPLPPAEAMALGETLKSHRHAE